MRANWDYVLLSSLQDFFSFWEASLFSPFSDYKESLYLFFLSGVEITLLSPTLSPFEGKV